jgi:serine/threonine protein kinase
MKDARSARQLHDDDGDELPRGPDDSIIEERVPTAPQLTRLGRYRLVREIASGGMASVNLAVTEGLDKLVALKMIHPHLAKEDAFVHMFLDEARIASSISHRNVCNTFDFGESEGRCYIAMDYLAGHSLRDVIVRLRKLPAESDAKRLAAYMAYILAEACEGLHAAHELRGSDGESLQVVHRDVSPHNLFLTYEGNVSVVDFGIARAADRIQHTATGVLKGKFSYMAPEQVRQLDIDRRVDIWSLGVVLWESLTLERLFVRSSQADTLMSVMTDKVRAPSEVRADLPAGIDAVVAKALARNPKERYATAREMGRDLMQVARESSVLVGPVELEQWMERLFPREKEQSRSLMRRAKQAALEDSWAEGTPTGLPRVTTRSGLVPRLPRLSSSGLHVPVASVPPSGSVSRAVLARSAPQLEAYSDNENAAQEAASVVRGPAVRSARMRTIAAALLGLSAALGVSFALEHTERDHPREALTSELSAARPAARPVTLVVDAPASITPAAVLPAALAAEPAQAPSQAAAYAAVKPAPSAKLPGRPLPARAKPVVASAAPAAQEAQDTQVPSDKSADVQAQVVSAASKEPASEPVAAAPAPVLVAPAVVKIAAAQPAKPSRPLDADVQLSGIDVEGSLGSGIVTRMLSRATPLVHTCYVEAAKRAAKNDFSSLKVGLNIDESGSVRSVETSAHPLPSLSRCAADALKRLRSDRKPDVGTVQVHMEIQFRGR